jgi:hypothetical protein
MYRIHVWFQVNNVTELCQKKTLTTKLGTSIGEVLAVDMNSSSMERGVCLSESVAGHKEEPVLFRDILN